MQSKIWKHLNVVTVKVDEGDGKYTAADVNRMYRMVKGNCSLPFTFYCVTNDSREIDYEIECIPLPDHGLKKWWHKMTIFNIDFPERPTIYFDLDVVIQNDVVSLLDSFRDQFLSLIVKIEFGSKTGLVFEKESITPLSWVNSSIMVFWPMQHKSLLETFLRMKQRNVEIWKGMDRYISSFYMHLIHPLDKSKHYYFRQRNDLDENSLVYYPHKTICVCTNVKNPEIIYKGLEKYFL